MRRCAFIVAALALAAGAAAAQDPRAVAITLEEAQARALETSHRLAEARSREAAAEAAAEIRAAADRPLVGVSAGYTRTNHVHEFSVPSPGGGLRVLYPDVPDNYRTRIDLQWPIYSGGRTDALERAARLEAAASAADLDTARADLRLEVARAFWAVVTARAAVIVLENGVERARAHEADASERFRAGLVPPNEVSSAVAQRARQEMLLIEARNQYESAHADLARLIDAPAGVRLEPDADLDEVEGGPPAGPAAAGGDVEALIADARASRSERLALRRRVEAAEAQRAAAAAGRRPTLALGGGYDYASPNPRIFPRAAAWNDSWDLSVNVGWSLWDSGRTGAEAAQAASLAEAARRRLAEFDAVLAVDVRQRALEIVSGRAAVAAADEAVRAASDARRVVVERYRAGVSTQTEVLDAEFALLQAELDRTRARASVRLAEARLRRALGR